MLSEIFNVVKQHLQKLPTVKMRPHKLTADTMAACCFHILYNGIKASEHAADGCFLFYYGSYAGRRPFCFTAVVL